MDLARGPLDARQVIEDVAKLRAQRVDIHLRHAQQVAYRTALLVEQRHHQVNRFDELVIAPHGEALRIGQRHLKFIGQFIHSHPSAAPKNVPAIQFHDPDP